MNKETKKLVIARLEQLPDNIRIHGEHGSFTREDLIKAVEKDSELGRKVAKIILAYIKSFVKLKGG